MQIRTRIKITTEVRCIGYELMSKLLHGRSLFYALIHLLEGGIKVENALEPSRTNIGWGISRYTLN